MYLNFIPNVIVFGVFVRVFFLYFILSLDICDLHLNFTRIVWFGMREYVGPERRIDSALQL